MALFWLTFIIRVEFMILSYIINKLKNIINMWLIFSCSEDNCEIVFMDYSESVEAPTLIKVLDSEGIFWDLNKWDNYKLNWMTHGEAVFSPVPLG